VIIQHPSGAVDYRCLHNSCSNKRWAEYRELREPGYRDRMAVTRWHRQPRHPNDVPGQPADGKHENSPIIRCAASIEPRRVQWLWERHIPRGGITLIVGVPGAGKGMWSCDIGARVTTGTPFPDGSSVEQGDVLLINGEDDEASVTIPRLLAHHADMNRVHLFNAVKQGDGELFLELKNLPAIETAIQTIGPNLAAVVIDPVGSFLGGDVDAHRDNAVRSVLAPIAKMAEKYNFAAILIAHRRKATSNFADDLCIGSRAFTGLARSVWHLCRDPEDKKRRLFVPGKQNYAAEPDGLAFTIAGDPPCVQWEADPISESADDVLRRENRDGDGAGRPAEERERAAAWLGRMLADFGEYPVAEIEEAANAVIPKLSWRTVQRARKELGVIVHRGSFGGGYMWRLPRPGSEPTRLPATCLPHAPQAENIGTHGEQGGTQENIDKPACQRTMNAIITVSGGHGQNGKPYTGLNGERIGLVDVQGRGQ
jgi:hypothetical protein